MADRRRVVPLLAVLALATSGAAPDPSPVLTYGATPALTAEERTVVTNALTVGWQEFAAISGAACTEPPPLRETDYAGARVAVDRKEHPVSAFTVWYDGHAQPYIVIHLPRFTSYTEANRGHVIAHELLHFYYELPDHHKGKGGGGVAGCSMDNWFRYGWTAALCDSCRSQVKARQCR